MSDSWTATRRALMATAAGIALGGSLASTAAASTRKPNFIVVLCDDLGFGDIGPYGAKLIPTPNLDQMAREGTTLTNYYAPANLCTPSRASMLTGRYAVRSGLAYGVIMQNDTRGLPLSEVTIPKALKPAGYTSAHIGKWHLGHQGQYWPPTVHGFDRFYGIPYSHDMNPLAIYEAEADRSEVNEYPVDFIYPDARNFDQETDDISNLTSDLQQKFYAEAEKFIEKSRSRPFFLQLALSTPHLPDLPSAPFKGKSKAGPYGDTVVEIDAIMGRLLGKLRALGLAQDTLVVFTSDNGPWYWGSAGPLRERKAGGAYDGGYRVPCLVWRPGSAPAGLRSDCLSSGIDWLPTFSAMAGLKTRNGIEIDGVDLTDALHDGTAIDREIILFQGNEPVAIRTPRWKYVAPQRNRAFPYEELYDMEVDVSESYNMRGRHPEVAKALRAKLNAAKAKFKSLGEAPAG